MRVAADEARHELVVLVAERREVQGLFEDLGRPIRLVDERQQARTRVTTTTTITTNTTLLRQPGVLLLGAVKAGLLVHGRGITQVDQRVRGGGVVLVMFPLSGDADRGGGNGLAGRRPRLAHVVTVRNAEVLVKAPGPREEHGPLAEVPLALDRGGVALRLELRRDRGLVQGQAGGNSGPEDAGDADAVVLPACH